METFWNRTRGWSGYGITETALVVIVVAVLIAVVVGHYERNIREANETAVRAELASLRNTINLFAALKGRCPEPLREIITAEFAIPYKAGPFEVRGRGDSEIEVEEKILFEPKYIEAYALDEEGNVLDPFGLPYAYDPATCKVHSRKSGYELY